MALKRNKTDAAEEALLVRCCEKMVPPTWQPPPQAYRTLPSLVERRQAPLDMHQQEAKLETAERESIAEHLGWLEARIAELAEDVDNHIDGNKNTLGKDAALLASILGVARTTADKVMGLLGDLRRFDSGKASAAFIGVTPGRHESGDSDPGRSSISRAGHTGIRHALFNRRWWSRGKTRASRPSRTAWWSWPRPRIRLCWPQEQTRNVCRPS